MPTSRYSDRAFLGSITHPSRAADSIEMCRILHGAETVAENCVIMGNFNTTSPLVIDGITTRGIRTYAEAGQGCGDRAVPARRGGDAGDDAGLGRAVPGRGAGRGGADAAGPARRPGGARLLRRQPRSAVGLADLRHARGVAGLADHGPDGAAAEPAAALLGQLLELQDARRAGDERGDVLDAGGGAVGGQLRAALGRLPRRAALDVVREVRARLPTSAARCTPI